MEKIISKENKYYKFLKKLKEKKYRDENNVFFAEGEKFLLEKTNFIKIIIKYDKYEYFVNKYMINNYDNVILLENSLFEAISSQENSQGIILIYYRNLKKLEEIQDDIIILDDVQDPGNIGSIIRTLVATNYKNLILTKGSVDVYSPKVVRATMGAIFKLNIIYSSREEIIKFLKDNNYQIISTVLSKNSIDYSKLKIENKNAYIFGHEGSGVSEIFINNSIHSIIPIYGDMESLNVAVALGVFLYKMRELEGIPKI